MVYFFVTQNHKTGLSFPFISIAASSFVRSLCPKISPLTANVQPSFLLILFLHLNPHSIVSTSPPHSGHFSFVFQESNSLYLVRILFVAYLEIFFRTSALLLTPSFLSYYMFHEQTD